MRTRTEPVIAVLGSTVRDGEPLPALRSRLDTAARQWQIADRHGLSPYVFCLGGKGSKRIEDEAPIMADCLVALGVPRSRIIEEAYSRTTEENLLHLHAILHDPRYPGGWAGRRSAEVPDVRELKNPERPPQEQIIIVTSGFHLPRTLLMARNMGFDAHGVGAPSTCRDTLLSIPREFGALVLWGVRALRRTIA